MIFGYSRIRAKAGNMVSFYATGRKMSLTNKKGFTLAELLIAAAIFAFAISGILLLFIKCVFFDQANRNKSIAITHAEFVMEGIMEYMRIGDIIPLQEGINYGNWSLTNTTTVGQRLGCALPVYPCVLSNESITTTCVNATNPLNITVTVSWKDRAQTNNIRLLELETLISKR